MPKAKSDFTNFIDARPNYFPGQFLLEDDFEIEQKYFIDRQKYHRQSLHVSGIIEGLEVVVMKDKQEVVIRSGSGINSNGDLIILKKDTFFSQFTTLTVGELYISYREEKQVKQQEDFTRWQEVPTIGFAATTPNDGVKLAKISIVNNVPTLDLTVRSYSGIFLPNATGNDLTLRSGGDANPNVAILNGSLTVTGTFTVSNKLAVSGDQKIEFSDTDLTNNLKLQLWTGYGLGVNDGTLFYAANGKHSWRDTNGANERMVLTLGDNGFLTVNGTGTSSFAGNLRVTGTITGKIDAVNINSGVLDAARIANNSLSSDKIISLSADKITSGTISGNLSVTGALNADSLVLGPTNASNLRLGYHQDYSWIQSHGNKPLVINTSNNVGIGSTVNPIAKLDISSASRTGTHPTAVKGLYITGDFNGDSDGVEFRHSNGSQGIGFGFNTIYAAGSNANQDLSLKPKGTGQVTVSGSLTVNGTGTSSFAGSLRVSGAITPSAGNSESNGIMFPLNPGGGGGDAAWIRYWASSGEDTTFEIGTSNDTNDILLLRAPKIQSTVSITLSSSRDFKENITDISCEEALKMITKLRPVKYDYKKRKDFRQILGFIAEEMPVELASKDYKTISPMEMIPVLTKVLQRQQEQIELLSQKIFLD